MPGPVRPLRASFERRASKRDALPNNRLAFMDHAMFAEHTANGRNVIIQVVFIYEQAIDINGVKRFNQALGYGLLGRRVERSSFGRYRWVSSHVASEIDIADCPRPRAELSDWADERSQLPTDPELGPGWHIGVLPLTDGSTAVSLVVSHYLIDGFGLAVTIIDALLGKTLDLGYPQPGSRTRLRAVTQDVREASRDAREVGRALGVAAKLARRRRHDGASSTEPRPVAVDHGDGDESVVMPVITMHIDADEWDARAKALGGTGRTLLAGFGAKLGERMGRRRVGDGAVTLQLPISARTESDTRAIAVSFAQFSVDPTPVTTNLGDVRAAVKQALDTLRETPDESVQLLWLVPFAPQRVLKRIGSAMGADPNHPVFCSNLGDLGFLVYALARTEVEYAIIDATLNSLHLIRVSGQRLTRQLLERTGGQMMLQSWRIGAKIGITIEAYQPGATNTKSALRELAARTLAEFELTGEVD
ncbi:hypothetical protein A5753_07445 [Mycobacterium sp. 852002-51971_SCH5477799-a]|uniref:hypothetical protein n=1 Tax=Mycobacterium sp. 852002-51971_SCH5477799-a TaxID=1834106 RepID=UPI0007FCAC49|nr:hypothetical protein [Mycobacterium sp. 852002-51971_SCH5477799-a]OBF66056.1 hypothetical protein A5753_07445 [Mycobacterium sp. 852002-51971_SCH5477799-a]